MEQVYKKLQARVDGLPTRTSAEQAECERTCTVSMLPLHPDDLGPEETAEFQDRGLLSAAGDVLLLREKHIAYLRRGLSTLPASYVSLDASRPWIIYWIVHSLDLLGAVPMDLEPRIVETLKSCADPKGGFGGGPQQLPHCAPTYAAVLTLLLLGTENAYAAIDRPAMYSFFLSLKHPSGGFRMHADGEVDVRGTYTAIAVAALLNIVTAELTEGVAQYVLASQTYEGGFGGEPWAEAHGGYAFCAFATLCILDRANEARLDCLEWWLCNRQMQLEGGFQGRTNKLVDGCYSFWQGGTAALLEYQRRGLIDTVTHVKNRSSAAAGATGGVTASSQQSSADVPDMDGQTDADGALNFSHMVTVAGQHSGNLPYNQRELQRYILLCAQQIDGGLRDKPGRSRDYYHTCYNLSGLSVSQHCLSETPCVLGDSGNEVMPTNAVYNITEHKAVQAIEHFSALPCSHTDLLAAAATAQSSS